jgi:hypothetical protein
MWTRGDAGVTTLRKTLELEKHDDDPITSRRRERP